YVSSLAFLTLKCDALPPRWAVLAKPCTRPRALRNRLFVPHGIPLARPFRHHAGGEQIHGAFLRDGRSYLVECCCRADPADIRQLDGLLGQVQRSGVQTMGLFLSRRTAPSRSPTTAGVS